MVKPLLNKKRLDTSYPDDIITACKAIAFNFNNLLFYGSQAKKSMYLSSGDIDLLEPVDIKQASELMKRIQAIVKELDNKHFCYIGDFKSGRDFEYIIDLGTIKRNKVIGFNKADVIDFINSHEFEEKNEMLNLCHGFMTVPKWTELTEMIRKKQVLRWNKIEIQQGFKTLRGKRVFLEDCIKDREAMTKIDTYQFIPSINRFVEITNYFFTGNKKGDFDKKKFQEELKINIVKMYCDQKYFKLCKRLITFYLNNDRLEQADKIYDIVHSGLGIIYQVCSELDAISYIIDNYKSQVPKPLIKEQLEAIKYRLGNVYEFDFSEASIDKDIDNIVSNETFEDIQSLSDDLYDLCNKITKHKLKSLRLIPLPLNFYP